MTDPYVQEDDDGRPPVTLRSANRFRGRAVPDKPTFTFPDSKITVVLPRVGPDTLELVQVAVNKALPPPPIPRIVIGDPEDGETELNPQDPEYRKALAEHAWDVQFEIGKRLYAMGLQLMEFEIDQERLQRHLSALDAAGVEIPEGLSDRDKYIRFVMMSSKGDVEAMMAYMMRADVPKPEEVQAYIDTFRNQVQ